MKVKMYKAVDTADGAMSLFAVRGNEMAVSPYIGQGLWVSPDKFGDFNKWHSNPLDKSRMINPVLIWESEDEDYGNTERI